MWTINNRGEMAWVNNDHEYTMTTGGTYTSYTFYEESCVADNTIWDTWVEAIGLKPKKKCLFEE